MREGTGPRWVGDPPKMHKTARINAVRRKGRQNKCRTDNPSYF